MMKQPSRKMPEMQNEINRSDTMIKVLNTLFFSGLIYLLVEIPIVIPLLALFVFWGKISYRKHQAKLDRLIANRQSDSICTFARSFYYRNVDTWAIRAVYEYIQKSLENNLSYDDFPIRKEDNLSFFDLDVDIEEDWLKIARRIGRATTLEDLKQNPFSGKVRTVEDLVFFLVDLPKTSIN